jgi:hypothetical protein
MSSDLGINLRSPDLVHLQISALFYNYLHTCGPSSGLGVLLASMCAFPYPDAVGLSSHGC